MIDENISKQVGACLRNGNKSLERSIHRGGVSTTICARAGTGGNQLPLIVLKRIENESISKDNRSIVCEQSSGELYRAGCVQRYATSLQEKRR